MSDSHCQSRNCPGFDPNILRNSGFLVAVDKAMLNKVRTKKLDKNPPFLFI
jgi:hypothetical protein